MKKTIQLLGAVALTVAVGGAQATSLTDLLDGASITAGDKVFDSFEVLFNETSDFEMIDDEVVFGTINTDNIDVTALDDGGMDPGPGLQFDILNSEFLVTGDDLFAYKDFQFTFRVTPLEGAGVLIKDVSLDLSGSISWTVDDLNDNGMAIVESVGTAAGDDSLGSMENEFSLLDEDITNSATSELDFDPQGSIWVTKNILVWATDSTDTANLTGFTQRFSQTPVPVPAPLALLALGLLGIGWSRRRH